MLSYVITLSMGASDNSVFSFFSFSSLFLFLVFSANVLVLTAPTFMSNKSSNRVEVPEAKEALDRFKTEVASELGISLKEGYNGDLTSREAGSIGGEMVRRMIKKQEEQMK